MISLLQYLDIYVDNTDRLDHIVVTHQCYLEKRGNFGIDLSICVFLPRSLEGAGAAMS